jgi:hypothetical protein
VTTSDWQPDYLTTTGAPPMATRRLILCARPTKFGNTYSLFISSLLVNLH